MSSPSDFAFALSASAAIALLLQRLGLKHANVLVGVAPPDAQLGKGSNTGADYSTPIVNAEIALMSTAGSRDCRP